MATLQGHTDCTTSSSVGAEGVGGVAGSGRGRRGSSGGSSHVDTDRILSTTWVVDTASSLAGGVTLLTVADALVAGLGTDEVGHCLGVLGSVGADAIIADARIGQCILVHVSMDIGG
jgi:hypothetical protein